jgi:phage terminase large subunit
VWLPHDARAKTLATKRSVVEQFIDEKIRPRIVPNLDLQDGIQAARLVFGSSWFDETGCRDGILALKSYRREWDEDNKTFREKPVHDWASHYGDAFRYFALVARKTHPKPISKEAPAESVEAHGAHYAFSLDQLHRDRRRLLLRRR